MLRGKVNIKLINAESGEVEQELEKTNLVTKGLEQYIGAKSLCNPGNINWLRQLSPLIQQGLGGLMVFSDFLTENALVTTWSGSQKLLCTGSDDSSGTNYRPVWRGKMSGTTLNGSTASREWTFELSRCNGTVKALALTETRAFGENQYQADAFVFNSAVSTGNVKTGWRGHTVYALPSGKGVVFLSARMTNSTTVVLDTYAIDDVLGVSNQMGNPRSVHTQSITVTGNIDGVWYDPITNYYDVRWEMCDDYHIVGHIVQDGALRYFKFDCTTLGQDTTVEVGSVNMPAAFSDAKSGVIKNGYYYYMAHTQSHGSEINVIVRLDISTGAYMTYVWSTISTSVARLLPGICGGILYVTDTGSTPGQTASIGFGYMQPDLWEDYQQVEAMDGSLSVTTETESSVPAASTFATFDIMPISRCLGYTPYVGAEKCQTYVDKYDNPNPGSFKPYSGLTANRAYVGTVFNLPTPITKTDAQEMVVEYTLTEG